MANTPQASFPLFVRAKDSGEIASFNSVSELQRHVEKIDIENKEYEAWDSNGVTVELESQQPIWVKLELSQNNNVDGLRRALLDFGRSVGIQLPELLPLADFEGALQRIRQAHEDRLLAASPVRRLFSRLRK